MDQHTSFIIAVVGIAAEVIALIDHDAAESAVSQALCRHEAGKTSTDDQEIDGRNG